MKQVKVNHFLCILHFFLKRCIVNGMTIKEFAELAGVSASTVSRIMNGKDAGISAETRAHVLRLAKEYHYKTVHFGATPHSKSFVLGVVTGNQNRFDRTLSGFIERASSLNYAVLVKDSANDAEAERKNILSMLEMNVDGLVFDPVASSDPDSIKELIEKSGIPFLYFLPDHNRAHSLPFIDFEQMGYAAAKKLIDSGHTQIACFAVAGARTAGFLQGYRQCLFDHAIVIPEDLVFHDEETMIRKFSANLFTGLLVSHYSMALRISSRMRDLHYAIPNDLSVISLNNDITSGLSLSGQPVSSIRIPFFEYGRHLAENLVCRIEKKQPPAPFTCAFAIDSVASVGPPYPSHKKHILSVGSVNIDNYLNFNELPHSGTSAAGSSLCVYPGGKCVNQAIGASLLGHPVSVIGRVGDDADSDNIYKTIQEYSVDHQGLMRTDREKTGQAYIFVDKNGESMISLLPGANDALTPEDMRRNRHLFFKNGFCLLQSEIPMPALMEAARLAKENKMTTVLKPSACDYLPEELLDHVDMLLPNQDELNRICPEGDSLEEKTMCYLKRGIETVIVTRGALGCYVRTKELSEYIPAIDITTVDVSGAGDAFICCLVSCLIDGCDIISASRIATYAAGISTTRQGTVPALVDRSTLESYIRNREPELLQSLRAGVNNSES